MRSLTRPGQLGLGEIRAGSSTVSRRGVAARPPPLGISKRIYITPTPQNRTQTYFFASSYNTSTSADAIARTLFAMHPRKKPPTPSF